MVTMREDGYLKALTGLTTLNEINRVAAAESI
jgi:type II secretory ATPase GspE/PulE/Tfp pilus assembly ATPase PilB-like protein